MKPQQVICPAGAPEGLPAVTCVIPVYNEHETLRPLVERIEAALSGTPHRILFVDDGSTDGSREVLRALHGEYEGVDVILFRRNRGKTAALSAGFAEAATPYIVTLDADLQDDPKEIPRLLAALETGLDIAVGWKQTRHDPWHKVWPSRIYNGGVARLFGLPLHDINCGLKAYRAEAAKSVALRGQMHRLIPVLAARQGYRSGEVAVEHHPRRHGYSKYGVSRFLYGGLDVLTAWFLDRYGDAPAHFFGKWGLAAIALGLAIMAAGGVAAATVSLTGGVIALVAGALYVLGGKLFVLTGLLGELMIRQHGPMDIDGAVEQRLFH